MKISTNARWERQVKRNARLVTVRQCLDRGLIDRRIYNKLVEYGYVTLGDLADATIGDLEKMPAFGETSRDTVVDILRQNGLTMRHQSEEALAASEFQRRSRLKGVKFAIVSGVLENGDVITNLVLVHRPDETFKSPGVEEQKEWNRRYPNGLDNVPAAPRAR